MVALTEGPRLTQAKFTGSLRVAAQPLKTDRHVIAGRATETGRYGEMSIATPMRTSQLCAYTRENHCTGRCSGRCFYA